MRPIKNVQNNKEDIENILKKIFPEMSSKTIGRFFVVFFLSFLLGSLWSPTCRYANFLCFDKKLPSVKELEIDKVLDVDDDKLKLELVSFEDSKKFWNLGGFEKQKDGFYCPQENEKYEYYYIWYKEKILLISNYIFNIYTRPNESVSSDEIGEVVIKVGKDEKKEQNSQIEYSELYLPARNKETVQYKQTNGDKLEFFKPGQDIKTPVKLNSAIEILISLMIAEDNKVKPEYFMTYISKTLNSARLTDHFIYPSFVVDRIRPNEELVKIGLGTDKNSCIKIDTYSFNISKEDTQIILNTY